MNRRHYIRGTLLIVLVLLASCRRVKDAISVDPKLEKAYDVQIVRHAQVFGLEPELLKAVIWKESRFRREQIGSKGELGLMQLMRPAIQDWARVNHREVPADSEVMDPDLNIEIGAWYLAWCGKRFPNRTARDYVLLLAIYNAGYGRVRDNWLPKDPAVKLKIDDITYPSTRDYIQQIMERAELYRERQNF